MGGGTRALAAAELAGVSLKIFILEGIFFFHF